MKNANIAVAGNTDPFFLEKINPAIIAIQAIKITAS